MPGGWTPHHHPGLNRRMRVRWEVTGCNDAPTLFVLGGISANRHVTANNGDPRPGWWRWQVGGCRAIDPTHWRIVGMDFLAPNGLDSRFGPCLASHRAEPLAPGELHLTPEDQADALFTVADHLGVKDVHGVVGASYGGSVALAAALAQPERIGRLVMLAAAHRSHPHATALRLVQRQIVEMAIRAGEPKRGLSLARGLAFTTYRTATEFEERFASRARWNTPSTPVFDVKGYMDGRGDVFAASTDPGTFLTLSESIDLCNLDPSRLRVPTYLISFDEDTLVPPWLVAELESKVPGPCCHFRLSAKSGHDGFLMDAADLSAALATSLTNWPEGGCR